MFVLFGKVKQIIFMELKLNRIICLMHIITSRAVKGNGNHNFQDTLALV